MKKEDLRIVFMGTPEFAVETLRALVDNGYNVVAVVTQPDKPVGRHGSVVQPSAVKQYAQEKGEDTGPICRWWWLSECCRRWFGICLNTEHSMCMPHCCRSIAGPRL